jgi:hypothetical protein
MQTVLDSLATISFPDSAISADDSAQMISNLCWVVQPSSELSSSKLCELISSMCSKTKIGFSRGQLSSVVNFFVSYIGQCSQKASWFAHEALSALSFVLYENGERCAEDRLRLLEVLLPCINPATVDMQAKLAAVNCVGNLVMKVKRGALSTEDTLPLWQALLQSLETHSLADFADADSLLVIKILSSTIRDITFMFPFVCGMDAPVTRIEHLVAILTTLLVKCVDAEDMDDTEEAPGHGSDNESAGMSSAGFNSNSSASLVRVRAHCLSCIQALFQYSKNVVLHGAWAWKLFLPEQPVDMTADTKQSHGTPLAHALLWDPSTRVRVAATAAITAAFSDTASMRKLLNNTAALSGDVLSAFCNFHELLCVVVGKENSPSVLAPLMKCVAAVTQFQYHEIRDSESTARISSFLVEMLHESRALLYCPEGSLRSAAVGCIGALLGTSRPFGQINALLVQQGRKKEGQSEQPKRTAELKPMRTKGIKAESPKFSSARSSNSRAQALKVFWSTASESVLDRPAIRLMGSGIGVLPQMFQLLADKSIHGHAQLELFHALARAAKNYGVVLCLHWDRLLPVILEAFCDMDEPIRLHGLKLLESFMGAMSGEGAPSEFCLSKLSKGKSILTKHLPGAFKDSAHAVRGAVCGCYTNIRRADWDSLPLSAKEQCFQSTCFCATKDKFPAVRAAAYQLLGMLASFQDNGSKEFSQTLSQVLLAGIGDSNLVVRQRTVSSLAIFARHMRVVGGEELDDADPSLEDGEDDVEWTGVVTFEVERSVFVKMVSAVLGTMDDNDKVVSNSIRALGFLSGMLRHRVADERALQSEVT